MMNHSVTDIAALSDHEPLITEDQAAEFLCLSKRTLQNWRWRGGGRAIGRGCSRCGRRRAAPHARQ